jgi:hypothetical protein
MTPPRWEYLHVVWIYKRTTVKVETYKWTQIYWVYRPGVEKGEERFAWSEDTTKVKVTFNDILNELGSEGWELVSESVLDSVVFSNKHGVEMVGAPLRMRWNFKRPARD